MATMSSDIAAPVLAYGVRWYEWNGKGRDIEKVRWFEGDEQRSAYIARLKSSEKFGAIVALYN